MTAQVSDRRIDVFDVERQVVAADIAVAGRLRVPLGRVVLEDLEVRAVGASEEAEFAHHRARVHVEAVGHPRVIGVERAERVHEVASDHVDEEPRRLFEVGDSEAHVLDPGQSRQTTGSPAAHRANTSRCGSYRIWIHILAPAASIMR
nr:hypothetical protein [Allosalinactinospora lopnorensis]